MNMNNINMPTILLLLSLLAGIGVFAMNVNAQSDITGMSYDTMLSNAISKASSQITSNDAKIYISEASSLRSQKKYNDTIIYLNKALIAENQDDVRNNINKLKQWIKDMGLNASFKPLDDEFAIISKDIADGNIDEAKQDVENIKTDITTYSEDSAKVTDAIKIIEYTSKLNFWWAEKPNTSYSNEKLNNSKIFLSQGDYKSAADKATTAVELAKGERKIFWNNVKSDYILKTLFDIDKVLTGDPERLPKKIERINFTWKSISYINIDFSKPITEMPSYSEQEISISNNSSDTTPKKPIHFELDPGSPTNCGTTCRQTTATLTNTGDEIAHNVKISLVVNNNVGDNIYSTQESLGDMYGGQSITKTEVINVDCGFLYGKCYGHMPFTLKSEVLYDEGTQTFPDQQFSE